jgi:radical SAM protein with 4Fe4S-binding SPASM domain
MLTEATELNLKRKASYADYLQLLPDGKPLFSWLDLSITELCNRSADAGFYPNQNLHMSTTMGMMIAEELHELKYKGAVVLCGFGEPLLHPQLEEFCRPFKGLRLEVVTNGDRLTADRINTLVHAGVSYFVVSMYDGPHQVDKFDAMFCEAGVNDYILRDRWWGEEADYGLKLTNRAGTITTGHQKKVNIDAKCFYPSYSMAVDWNGDVLLCVQDWNKKLRFANLNNVGLVEAWRSTALNKIRKRVAQGNRSSAPCNACNAEGTCHGEAHARVWLGDD